MLSSMAQERSSEGLSLFPPNDVTQHEIAVANHVTAVGYHMIAVATRVIAVASAILKKCCDLTGNTSNCGMVTSLQSLVAV